MEVKNIQTAGYNGVRTVYDLKTKFLQATIRIKAITWTA